MLTIADYERLPMDLVRHQELVGGHLVDTADRTLLHNYTRDTVLFHLLHWAGRRRNGTVIGGQCFDFQGDILGPDVSFSVLEKESLWELDKRVQPFIPDLAIEVASSSDLYRD